MIKNWLVSCSLLSPLVGEPPKLDALLAHELSMRLGFKHERKMTRAVRLNEVEKVPIPLSKITIGKYDTYRCSDPIVGNVHADWSERLGKRFDTNHMVNILHHSEMKNVLTSSGPYKNRFVPERARLIDKIYWFFRGDRKEVNKLLKKIIAIGHLRHYGYGRIGEWEYKEQENDLSVTVNEKGKNVLMKTIPADNNLKNLCGYRRSYGGAFIPYWHPENYMEVFIPC